MPNRQSQRHALEEDELIFARLRAYVERHGRTAEILKLRDKLEFPGVYADWSAGDIWDPSNGIYSVAVEA